MSYVSVALLTKVKSDLGRKFTSGNSVPVSRVFLSEEEKAVLHSLNFPVAETLDSELWFQVQISLENRLQGEQLLLQQSLHC